MIYRHFFRTILYCIEMFASLNRSRNRSRFLKTISGRLILLAVPNIKDLDIRNKIRSLVLMDARSTPPLYHYKYVLAKIKTL